MERLSYDIEIGDGLLTLILMFRKFMGGLVGGGCIWIIASALVLFLSFDI